MPIQWYPGHMAKARKALALALPRADVVVEVLDARAPRASGNPVVTELRAGKPCVKVLAKSDLADPSVTDRWVRSFARDATDQEGAVRAMASTTQRGDDTKRRLLALSSEVSRRTTGGAPGARHTRVIVVGVPNVGKSTLINTLVGRRVAKVGDEPAVTKATQDVVLPGNIVLSDNPGILWPKLEDEAAAYRLALAGALPDTAIDFESVALFGATFLLERYPDQVVARYGLTTRPETPEQLLDAVGRRRGCIRAGGVIDLHKVADIVIHDFRQGALGRISLEEP